MTIDLDAYFARIDYSGPCTAKLATLAAIHRLHPQAIAFENLNPLLGLGVRLDLQSIQAKLVGEQRGGYCFEHNLLFAAVLEQLGFGVTRLAARVLWGQPDDAKTARSHMLLAVDVEGRRYIADVGFGGQVLTGPLLLEPDIEQATPHEPFRLTECDEHLRLQSRVGDAWQTLYRFDLIEAFQADYEVSNYYLSTNPSSHFVTGLIAARTDPGTRYAIRNHRLAIHHVGAASEQRMLTSVRELRTVLAEQFRLTVPETPHTDEILGRVIALADVR
jgi:N-hydroxyarylamine O-acetyltransferase